MPLSHIDHVVLTVADIDRTVDFYVRALGMRRVEFNGRVAVADGTFKLNLHQAGAEFEPKAAHPAPGAVDLCIISTRPLEQVQATLAEAGVAVEDGPVARTGATGPMTSVYVRDPDANLVEIATYDRGRAQAPSPYDLLAPVPRMDIASADLVDGGVLADTFVFSGDNLSPQLSWGPVPAGTASLALTCFDPDAPTGWGFMHWAVVGIDPRVVGIERGGVLDGAIVLRNDFGNHGYDGCAPPPNDGFHRYMFAISALSVTAEQAEFTSDTALGKAGFVITATTLARGVITGLYENR